MLAVLYSAVYSTAVRMTFRVWRSLAPKRVDPHSEYDTGTQYDIIYILYIIDVLFCFFCVSSKVCVRYVIM
jgi:hypothetical protein